MIRDLDRLSRGTFDLLVVGGGVLGACVARDAALRGLQVALVDRRDFGGGVSANSLKIVHGGLRFLQKLDLRRVREGVRERSTWLRIAPHLIQPLPVLIPTHARQQPRRAILRLGLALNDVLSWDRNNGLAADRRLPACRAVSRAEATELVPELAAADLTGGILFHDAQMYSSERLVLELIQGAVAAGAAVVNYLSFEAPISTGQFGLRDELTGEHFRIRASMVVNAAGSGGEDVIRRLVGQRGTRVYVHQSLAVNVETRGGQQRVAFTIAGGPEERGRRLFLVPWRERLIIGTGHYAAPVPGSPPRAEQVVERFLAQVNRARPGEALREEHVLLVHSGLIPVRGDSRSEGIRFLRAPAIIDHARDGLAGAISVFTGKFTTARSAAELVVDRVVARLGRPSGPCVTSRMALPGAPEESVDQLLTTARTRYRGTMPADVLEHLVRTYGRRYERLLALARRPGMGDRPHPDSPVIRAQWFHAIQEEMAMRPEDLVWRRTELGARGLAEAAVRRRAGELLHATEPEPPCPTR